jgi:hypothetical protein
LGSLKRLRDMLTGNTVFRWKESEAWAVLDITIYDSLHLLILLSYMPYVGMLMV